MKGIFTITSIIFLAATGNGLNAQNSDSAQAVARQNCSVIPVRLKSFEATKLGAVNSVNWVTGGEVASKGFAIERRVGDRPWEPIGFVNSLAPGGYSTSDLIYAHTDYISLKEAIQYRLKLVDLNGNFEYSEIRIVKNEASNAITIFPNPTADNVNIAFADQRSLYSVRIYHEDGRLVNKWHNCRSVLTIANLKPDIYIIKIDEQLSKKVTIYKAIVLNRKG